MNDKRTTDEIDALAQEIRRVDGENNLGAGALAEALMPFLTELQHRREAEAGVTDYPPLVALGRVLGFFASVIKSGEPWSETCQREYEAANAALQAVYARNQENQS